MKKWIGALLISAVAAILSSGVTGVWADRGSMPMRPITLKENIDVFDSGQKAIICWNKGTELMILSTDKYASQATKVLEFMPLPSKPTRVEKADIDSFTAVAKLIEAHRPTVEPTSKGPARGDGRSAPTQSTRAEPAVQIVFHKKIGAHDIVIGKVLRLEGFTGWVKQFYTKQGMQYNENDIRKFKPLVADYLKRGYSYFVFDVIELTTEKQSISPILYQFRSKNIYFPLVVTTMAKGTTAIALYLFTSRKTDIWGTRTGFVSGFYAQGGSVRYDYPIKFMVSPEEIASVSNDLRSFMGGCPSVWFSTAKYFGPTEKLTRDFILK